MLELDVGKMPDLRKCHLPDPLPPPNRADARRGESRRSALKPAKRIVHVVIHFVTHLQELF